MNNERKKDLPVFSQGIAALAEVGEVGARTSDKTVWKLGKRVAAVAEVGEVSSIACVKTVWKLSQGIAAVAEVGEVDRHSSVTFVIVNEVEALQYVIVSAQTI